MAKLRKRRGRRRPVSAQVHTNIHYVRRPRVEIDRGLAWYAIFTAARAEARVQTTLRDFGLATYAPIEALKLLRRGRMVELERPAVSRYLFVGLDAAAPQWPLVQEALETPGPWGIGLYALGRVLTFGLQPFRVPAGQLARLADGLSALGHTPYPFEANARVRVSKGPWEAFHGTVEESDDDRVRALLDIFGRQTRVEFKTSELEAA